MPRWCERNQVGAYHGHSTDARNCIAASVRCLLPVPHRVSHRCALSQRDAAASPPPPPLSVPHHLATWHRSCMHMCGSVSLGCMAAPPSLLPLRPASLHPGARRQRLDEHIATAWVGIVLTALVIATYAFSLLRVWQQRGRWDAGRLLKVALFSLQLCAVMANYVLWLLPNQRVKRAFSEGSYCYWDDLVRIRLGWRTDNARRQKAVVEFRLDGLLCLWDSTDSTDGVLGWRGVFFCFIIFC